jgi:hypothetical protein
MSQTVSLYAFGGLMRGMQTDIRAITMKLDLLTRARDAILPPWLPAMTCAIWWMSWRRN